MSTARIQLERLEGDQVVETRDYTGDLIEIGKLSKAHLRLDDENVSRRHAKIEIESDGRVALIDLGSTNGTRLNGMRVQKAYLADGDEFEIGVTRLRIRLDAELKKAAVQNAPVRGAQINRDAFYRTEEAAERSGKLALEAALLWEDAPIQVSSFMRSSSASKFQAVMLLLFAIAPIELLAVGGLLLAMGYPSTIAIACAASGIGFALFFVSDPNWWQGLVSGALWTLKHGDGVHIGESRHARFFVPEEAIGAREYALLVPHGDGWALNLARTEIKGDVLHDGKVHTVEDARSKGVLKGQLLPLGPTTKARLRFGPFTMLVSHVPARSLARGGRGALSIISDWGYVAVSLILHVSMLILSLYYRPNDEIQIRRQVLPLETRVVPIESMMAEEQIDKKKEEELPEKKELEKTPEETVDLSRPKSDESEKLMPDKEEDMKPVEAKKNDNRTKEEKELSKLDPVTRKEIAKERAKSLAEQMAPQAMLDKINKPSLLDGFNKTPNTGLMVVADANATSTSDTVFGDPASSVTGSNPLGSGGNAGLQGDWAGGGTQGGGKDGTDGIEGLGKTDEKGKKALANVGFKGTIERKSIVTAGDANVTGGLTKAIIKKYINRQKGSIVLCYKKEVQKNPDLEGKVNVAFVITGDGKVINPSIMSSTLGSAPVEACITQRLAMWRFPAPENGGIAKVSYPFLFRTR